MRAQMQVTRQPIASDDGATSIFKSSSPTPLFEKASPRPIRAGPLERHA